ncbi:MAG TPA: long-chain fatty acid--CoA ligase [Baekduia sp.]|nr:long-chain fatty acid--CoA ligase [Baekduia sp.]
MQDVPLSISRLARHGTTIHGDSTIRTWTGAGFRSATYAEVGRRASQLAHALAELGVEGDARVATFMWNNQEHVEAYLAVPSMGAVLHTLNIRLFPAQLTYIANHAEDRVIICDGSLTSQLAPLLETLDTVEHVVVTGDADLAPLQGKGVELHRYDELLAGRPEAFDWPETDERDAAAMCYTSGTTGDPKGVVYSHRSITLHSMGVCMGDAMSLTPSDTVLTIVPQFHAMAWGIPYAAMLVGASVVMPDRFLQPEPILEILQASRATFAAAVPTIWQGLLALLDEQGGGDISFLRDVVVGGSACPESLMRAFADRYGVRLLHAWGMTETSPLGSVARPPATVGGEEQESWRYRVTQGRFVSQVEPRLVGPDGSALPFDGEAVGELEVRGPWITGSYYRDVDAGKFDGGWLRTGDVGTITDDSFLTLTDRAKDVIKSGGEWISSVGLENALMSHPDVAEAAVVGVPDERWGERPLAYVVLKDGAAVTAHDLKDFLVDKVARWQTPDAWAFIDEVPKTSVGKFDKKALRAWFAEQRLQVTRVA